MLKLLLRCAMFLLGLTCLVEASLPTRAETLRVDRHTSHQERSTTGNPGSRHWDTKYELHLLGGVVSSCSVGLSAYKRVNDGDTIDVRATRVFRHCVHLTHNGDVLQDSKYWRVFGFVFGLLAIGAGIGWLKSDDDGSVRIG